MVLDTKGKGGGVTRVLVIDNYDSFVYTLDGYLRELGAETSVIRNDTVAESDLDDALSEWDAVLLSPGPGTPADAGISITTARRAAERRIPVLGVCLGHQAIAEAFGATVTHADELMHGKTSRVHHDGSPLFEGVPETFTATRYHSLAVLEGTLPASLEVTARTDGGVIMGIAHRTAPILGVQFHPESVLTEGGYRMIGNWLESAGLAGASLRSQDRQPLVSTGH